jgi:uncharacterized protein involved in exopolysaccharide biosynthesis
MCETAKLRLPEGFLLYEDAPSFAGPQAEVLNSRTLRARAIARLGSSSNSVPLPPGDDGEPFPVDVRVAHAGKSPVYVLEASGSEAAYVQHYLDALMAVYLEYMQHTRALVSGMTLASITEQVQRAERDLKNEQDILTGFQQTNNLAVLQAQGAVAVRYLLKLNSQLSDLQLEDLLLKTSALPQAEAASRQTLQLKTEHIRNSIYEWETRIVKANSRMVEAERITSNVQRAQSVYDRLALLLQNVGISRNIQQQTLVILEPASPAARSLHKDVSQIAVIGFGGLALGLGVLALMKLYRAVRRDPAKSEPRAGRDDHQPDAATPLGNKPALDHGNSFPTATDP